MAKLLSLPACVLGETPSNDELSKGISAQLEEYPSSSKKIGVEKEVRYASRAIQGGKQKIAAHQVQIRLWADLIRSHLSRGEEEAEI